MDNMIGKLMNYGVALLVGVTIGVMVIGVWGYRTDNLTISYYATFERGETLKVDSIIAVPILSVEQIGRMWPEYYVETTVKVGGKEMTLRSKPFLFCDNPEMEGWSYAGRDIYCPLAKEKGKD